jgi:RecB family exonuclease
MIDQGDPGAGAAPEPKRRRELQPKSYSFSEVGRLRRDPYAIYARRVLRLDPSIRSTAIRARPNAARSITRSSIASCREGISPASPDAAGNGADSHRALR